MSENDKKLEQYERILGMVETIVKLERATGIIKSIIIPSDKSVVVDTPSLKN